MHLLESMSRYTHLNGPLQADDLIGEWIMTETITINTTTIVKRDPSLLSSRVDDDLVLFSAEQGMYYGTQAVGRRIWALIKDEVSIDEICDKLLEEFSVDRVTCQREVVQFIEQLAEEELIAVR